MGKGEEDDAMTKCQSKRDDVEEGALSTLGWLDMSTVAIKPER